MPKNAKTVEEPVYQNYDLAKVFEGCAEKYKEQQKAEKELFEPLPVAKETVNDNVNHPSHYTQGAIECIDAIEASMTPEQFRGAMKANIIKYLWRYEHKNGLEDLKKARFYLERMIASFEKGIGEEHA